MNAIECRDLTKAYRGFTLDHLTFSLPAGCILGLVGENGAGKSTTLKLLMNAISRDEVLDVFNDFTRQADHTVVLSSHIVSDLEKICDYIAFLHRGKLVLFEEKDRLLEEYAIVKLDPQQLQELNPAAIAGVKEGPYGAEALVRRQQIPAQFVTEHTNLEDIILFLAKGEGS